MGVELVRERQARVDLESRGGRLPPQRASLSGDGSMYLPITRWQRPR
jgi:hypothetical protein